MHMDAAVSGLACMDAADPQGRLIFSRLGREVPRNVFPRSERIDELGVVERVCGDLER